ncbi:MAG: hypothetical protein M1829_001140 [Trizodia sp. TS-e1964]|nr:MAG: hypothetical protein M1829_001140 [Trizodia sp. TS-e1964]
MAQISYEGALNHLNRGDIFHGLRFFISKACPSRNGYIEKVEYNGGEIVRKESEANILIFDHLNSRRNPINSVSYKFIDESIKIRRRVDVGEYPAGPRFKHVRSSGYSAPIKNTRTPFSLEDDKELLEHVRKAEKQGMKVLGNKVYQDLEEKV